MAIDGSMQLRERHESVLHPGDPLTGKIGEGNKRGPPEVQHRVGNGRSSVLERLDDDGKTFVQTAKSLITLKENGSLSTRRFTTLTVRADQGGEIGDESNSGEVGDVGDLQRPEQRL